jgi:glycosyltransferase involved in cell wall biosynthesis
MLRPLSILCLLRDPLPPRRADVLTLFGVELPRHGIHTALVGQAAAPTTSSWPGGPLHVAGRFGGAVNSLLAPLRDAWWLLRAASASRPDLIQVRDKILVGLFALAAATLLRIPFVYWMSFPIVEGYAVHARDGAVRFRTLHRLRAWTTRILLYRLVLPRAALVFVQSTAMADALVARGVPRARLVAVPMGVDVTLAAGIAPASDPRLAGRRVVVYLGSIARSRASTFLLDLADALALVRPEVLLVIAGDAPTPADAAWFRAALAGRANVLFTGWLAHAAALAYVARAEAGIAPIPRGALFDVSSPTKLVEYLALGVPAVVSDIPDQRHVIDATGAGWCGPMTVPAFCAAIVALLDDPERATRGARGQAWVRAHRAYDVIGRQVAQQYRRLLEPGAPA